MSQRSLPDGDTGTFVGTSAVITPPEPREQLPAVIDAEFEKPDDALILFTNPEMGIAHATQLANRLDHIITSKGLYVEIKGKRFIFVEAWCACSSMCGLSPRTVWCKRIEEGGKVAGYEARVEVVRVSTGEVVGAAEAECWMDEKLKGYARWTENHSAKAMAQTRATSRAIAQILRWIPVLAGYQGTPAEDLGPDPEPPVNNPSPKADAPRAQPRGRRVDPTNIGGLVEAWKQIRPPDERKPEYWTAFVEKHAMRTFDVTKASNWTEGDYIRVKAALENGL